VKELHAVLPPTREGAWRFFKRWSLSGHMQFEQWIGELSLWHATDFYAILGVRPTASLEEVNAAWKRKARVHHPDNTPRLWL
jgi:hypothetical protein